MSGWDGMQRTYPTIASVNAAISRGVKDNGQPYSAGYMRDLIALRDMYLKQGGKR